VAGDDSDKDKAVQPRPAAQLPRGLPRRKPPPPEEIPKGNANVDLARAPSGGERNKTPLEGALKALHDAGLAQELEIIRLRKEAIDSWEPPTEAQFNNWLTPDAAIGGLSGRIEDAPKKRWLVERLRGGAIAGVARQAQMGGLLRPFEPVPTNAWEHFDEDDSQFWEFGDATVTVEIPARPTGKGGYYAASHRTERFFDVRFHPDDLSGGARPRAVPAPPAAAEAQSEGRGQTTPLVNKGGRPAKPFWEDLLVEMFDQLWHGRLTPATQADIEKAMDSWLIAQGHEASERSIRERARKLWNAWIKEGNN
jgi:hypothetical protein